MKNGLTKFPVFMIMMMHCSQARETYLKICSRAMAAARMSNQSGKIRMNYIENAIKRALSEMGELYEERMYWLATIVSGAPF